MPGYFVTLVFLVSLFAILLAVFLLCQYGFAFAHPNLAFTRKTRMNRVRSLLSMLCMLLGYSFEPRPNSRALGIGFVFDHRFIKRMLALETSLTRENNID